MKYPLSHWNKVILLASFLTVFVSFSVRSGFGILLPEIMDTLALTKAQAGYIGSAYFVAYMVFAPILGNLTDKIGGRKVITAFCIVLGTGTVLMGTITYLWTACLFHFIVGVGAAACWAPVSALLQKWFSARQRGMALGILTVGAYLGSATMGIILPRLLFGYGWRFSWYLLGLLAFVMIPTNGFLLRSKPEDVSIKVQSEVSSLGTSMSQIDYREMLRTSKFWLIGTSYLAMSFATYVAYIFLVTYATLELKMEYTAASMLVTVLSLCGILGALIFPALSDRLGRRKTLAVSNLLLAFSLLAFVLVKSNAFLLTLSVVALGVFDGGIWPVYAACAADYFSPSVAGTVMGFWTTLYGLGSIISPPIAGYLADLYGTFFWSFTMSSIVAVIATLLILRVKDPVAPF